MEYIEVSARTVDDAITEALIKLGATSDQIEYEVIEKGSTGFLGIARKDAVIKVRKKYSVDRARKAQVHQGTDRQLDQPIQVRKRG